MEPVTLSRRSLLAALAGSLANRSEGTGTKERAGHPPAATGTIRLGDGRRVSYTEWGNPVGSSVVVYHHGQPSCRLEAELMLPALARRPDLRLIAFDRPGMGASDPASRPSFGSWADDLTACADALRLQRFGVTGTSAGTPFLLAAALRLPGRVTAVSVGCPVAELPAGSHHHPDLGAGPKEWRQAAAAPRLACAYLNAVRRRVERCPRNVVRFVEPLTPDELRRFDDPQAVDVAARILTESLRNGAQGVVDEFALLVRPWGLKLADIRVPVALFHGGLDRRAPPWMAETLSRAIPTASRHRTPGDGHLSLPQSMCHELIQAAAG